ncbi:hypothetical protein HJFPF1_01814 [Paramyrothecium foliicola]|nr:hypothetical protein HJFPF1_01814 [Paramyrothecium foliicola]
MVRDPNVALAWDTEDHGLRFTNRGWNGSIANNEPFALHWNESLGGTAELGLFRIVYPKDGLISYELVSNLTGITSSESCIWTPRDLKNDLYAFWLTSPGAEEMRWTISPPWRPVDTRNHAFHWAAPVGIPIVTLLSVYGIALFVCLMYRRRKKARRLEQDHLLPEEDANGRHPSVSSAVTVQTYDESDVLKKPSISLFSDNPPGSPGSRLTSLEAYHFGEPKSDCSCHVREPEKTMSNAKTELRRYSMV